MPTALEHAEHRRPDAEFGGTPRGLGLVGAIDAEQRGAFAGNAHDVFAVIASTTTKFRLVMPPLSGRICMASPANRLLSRTSRSTPALSFTPNGVARRNLAA